MESMFLTNEEMQELTGYRLYAWQRKWLDKSGWKYEIAINGRPVVLRAFAENQMGQGSKQQSDRTWEPNIEYLRNLPSRKKKP